MRLSALTHFADARHFASWFGLTPREYSSGRLRGHAPFDEAAQLSKKPRRQSYAMPA
ncbi:MAG: transposase [Burkholderiaceae bacterium]|nr:transposase [Burkholderiaceae bacterium]